MSSLVDHVRQQLENFTPKIFTNEHPFDQIKKSAVAILLREKLNQLELFFMVRATRPDDFWSGNIAFPGGRYSHIHDNNSLKNTAIRETKEEVGLNLETDFIYLGALNEILVPSFLLLVQPHVFLQKDSSISLPLELDEREVAHANWFPISFLLHQLILIDQNSSQLSQTLISIPLHWNKVISSKFLLFISEWIPNWLQIIINYPNFELQFPSSSDKKYLWGLTLRVVTDFFKHSGIYSYSSNDTVYNSLKQKLYGISNSKIYNYFILQHLDELIYKSHKTTLLQRIQKSKL